MNGASAFRCRARREGLRCAAVPAPESTVPTAASESLLVRRALPADLAALVELEHASFAGDRLSPRQWRHHLHSASAWVLVGAQGRRVAGAAVVFFRSGSRVARLYSLAVSERERGRGLGARLLEAVERIARRRRCDRLRLEVRRDNLAAQRLYERRGFHRIADIPSYYEDGEDAIRYEKPLA